MSKDAYYFSHDSNARCDPKILKMLMKYGMEGYGIYWCLIEMLREAPGYKREIDYICIGYELRTNCEIIRDIVINFDLFNVNEGMFYSESLLNRMKIRDSKSQKARESAQKRWAVNAFALRSHCDGNAIKERKGKESKEKEKDKKEKIKPISSSIILPDFINEDYWKDFIKGRKKLKAVNSDRALARIIKVLTENKPQANEMLLMAYENGWKMVFPREEALPASGDLTPSQQIESEMGIKVVGNE